MIVKMMKYNIVLFSAERERFIERLRELEIGRASCRERVFLDV